MSANYINYKICHGYWKSALPRSAEHHRGGGDGGRVKDDRKSLQPTGKEQNEFFT